MQTATQLLTQLVEALFQGILLSRYRDNTVAPRPIVNVSDLEHLCIDGKLGSVQVALPNPQHQLQVDDVIVTLRGSTFKASVVTPQAQGGVAGQNLAVLRPCSEINPLYLAVILQSQWMQTKLAGLYMQSTGTQVIRLSQLAELPIPIPALEIQNKLAQFFLATEKRNQIAQEEIIARQQVAEAVLINVVGAKA